MFDRMCGRFAITLVHGFFARFAVTDQEVQLVPRFNIAPTQTVPVIVRGSPNRAIPMRWGLIPFWAKDPKIGNRLINARAETLASKPAFRASMKRKRCLVPATGFYEWRRTGDGKQPYFVRRKDQGFFAFAGLHDSWRNPVSGEELRSFTIVTTLPNPLLATIHTRMPVILREDHEDVWLREGELDPSTLKSIFRPHPARGFEAYMVSTEVNNPKNDYPDLIERADGA